MQSQPKQPVWIFYSGLFCASLIVFFFVFLLDKNFIYFEHTPLASLTRNPEKSLLCVNVLPVVPLISPSDIILCDEKERFGYEAMDTYW